jgi:hypothetical protein
MLTPIHDRRRPIFHLDSVAKIFDGPMDDDVVHLCRRLDVLPPPFLHLAYLLENKQTYR